MTTLKTYFENGLSPEDYIAGMKVNREEMQSIYKQFELPEDKRLDEIKDKQLKVIVLTEDWCGDAMLNIPILMKIAEKTDMELRMVLRDENLDLMDQYLTNGTSRAIPIFIFMDPDFHQHSVWGPRAHEVQEYVMKERSGLDKDAPDYDEKNKALIAKFKERYLTTPDVWNEVYDSIVTRILQL